MFQSIRSRGVTRRTMLYAAFGFAALPVLQACQQAPAPAGTAAVVEVEKVVTQIVEVEKEVEVTKIVQETVEVTSVVEREVVVTATPVAMGSTTLQAVELNFTEPPTEESLAKAQELLNAPQVTVKVSASSDYLNKLKVQFAAGTGPDLFRMNVPSGKFWMAKGIMLSLEDWRKGNPQFAESLTTIVPSTITSYTWNGELRGVPFSAETSLGYYNIDWFEKAGVPTPAELGDKYDWNTQLEMFQKLSTGEGRDRVYGTMCNGHTQAGSAEFIYGAGAKIISDDGLESTCNSPEMNEAVQWMVDLIHVHKVSPEPDAYGKESGLNFFSAMHNWKTAYANSGEWAWWVFRDQQLSDQKFKLGFTEPPKHPKTGKRGAQGHTLSVAIYSQSRFKDEAAALTMQFAEKDVQALIAPKWLPARIDAQDDLYQGEGGAEIRPIVEATQQYSEPYPASALEEAAVGVFWTHLNQIFQQQETVEEGLTNAHNEITEAVLNAAAGR